MLAAAWMTVAESQRRSSIDRLSTHEHDRGQGSKKKLPESVLRHIFSVCSQPVTHSWATPQSIAFQALTSRQSQRPPLSRVVRSTPRAIGSRGTPFNVRQIMNPSVSREALIERIETAFAGVLLDDGVGLKEGQGLDDYEDEWVCRKYREEDEKVDWRRIPVAKLDQCHSSLSFFDPKGMRFHLPAYIVAHLKGVALMDPVFHLIHLDDYALSKLTLFSAEQKSAVEAYLWELMDDDDFEFDREMIAKALEDYWTKK